MPEHKRSDSDKFNLTPEKITAYVKDISEVLTQLKNIPIFFVGVSFGASFARHFADKFERPLINVAPFIEPFKWSSYFLLKFLSTLDIIPKFPVGSFLSTYFPKFCVGSPKYPYIGLSMLPGASIFHAYKWAQLCHYSSKKTSNIVLLLSKNDTTIWNEEAKSCYKGTSTHYYNGSHNLLSSTETKENLDIINADILTTLNNFLDKPNAIKPSNFSEESTFFSKLPSSIFYTTVYFYRLYKLFLKP